MGSFSLWHWLIVLIVTAVPIAAIATVVVLVIHGRRKSRGG